MRYMFTLLSFVVALGIGAWAYGKGRTREALVCFAAALVTLSFLLTSPVSDVVAALGLGLLIWWAYREWKP